jgi:hypothetical protein
MILLSCHDAIVKDLFYVYSQEFLGGSCRDCVARDTLLVHYTQTIGPHFLHFEINVLSSRTDDCQDFSQILSEALSIYLLKHLPLSSLSL